MTAPALEIRATAEAAEEAAAERIAATVRARPQAVLGLATGRTMIGVYRALLASGADLTQATTFNLDEYCGLSADHPGSFRAFMAQNLFGPARMRAERTHFPGTDAAAGEAYERAIAAAGGIDLQILGIGTNGHIGFNEPGSPVSSRTRAVTLSPATRAANAPQFAEGEVPERAVTMGIATILDARAILVVATGAAKAPALAAALEGPVSPDCPASFLARHPDVTVIADSAAASGLAAPAAHRSGAEG